MADLAKALINLRPTAKWVVKGDDYSDIQWLDDEQEKPSLIEVQTELERLDTEYENTEYRRLRIKEYPPINVQLDMQYWDSVNGTTLWQNTIQAIKDKYPKG